MKIIRFTLIFILGLLLGIGNTVRKNHSRDKDPNNVPPSTENSSAALRFKTFSRPGNFDFYQRISKNNVDYPREILRLFNDKTFLGNTDFDNISFLLSKWGKTSPQEALNFVETLPYRYRYSFRKDIYKGWADKNPEALAYYYLDNKNVSDIDALETALNAWGKFSPTEVCKFLATLSTDHEQKKGTLALIESVDPQKTDQFQNVITLIPKGQMDDPDVLDAIMNKWFSKNPVEASSWMESLSLSQQENLAKYKNLTSVDSIPSLLADAKNNPDVLRNKIEAYPRWLQAEAWAKIINEMSAGLTLPDLIKWSERIPSDLRSEIMESPYLKFSPFSGMSGDSPQVFEDVLSNFYSDTSPNWLTNIPYNVYKYKFAARKPEQVLDFFYQNQDYVDPKIIAHWLSWEPEKAQEWLKKTPLNSEQRLRINWQIPFHKPLVVIEKKHE